MYKYNEIKQVHLEISSLCQASCPMCARNNHGGMPNPKLPEANLSLEFYKQVMTPELLKQLYTISLCGNFGDPILNNDLLAMCEYSAEQNPEVHIHLHTNGSARSTAWWAKLAKALPRNHIVLFGIDGFEGTHELYRVGTSFTKIIDNAKAFIAAGGKARWNFITFKHNEHQLEAARQMSKDLGFESFQEKQTSRFIGTPYFEVYDRQGNVTHKLEQPTEQKIVFIDRKTVENYKEVFSKAVISCQVEEEKSVYVDAQGHLYPCCFLGSVPYQYSTPDRLVWNFMQESTSVFMEKLEAFGGLDGLDLRKKSIEEIVDGDIWQTFWNKSFEDKSILMCTRVCGKFPEPVISQCRDQFLELEDWKAM